MLKIILLKNVAYVDKAGYWAVDELSWAWCFLLSQHNIQIFKLFSASTWFLFLVSTWGAEGRQSPMAGGEILPDRTSTGQKYSEKVAKNLIFEFFWDFLFFPFIMLENTHMNKTLSLSKPDINLSKSPGIACKSNLRKLRWEIQQCLLYFTMPISVEQVTTKKTRSWR